MGGDIPDTGREKLPPPRPPPTHPNPRSLPAMHTRTKLLPLALALFGLGLVAQAAPSVENWENHCAKCHGADGKGATKVGKKLKLRDYTDAAVQAKMTDEEIIKAITDGVFEGEKEKMKAYKEELTAAEIAELLAYVRKFRP